MEDKNINELTDEVLVDMAGLPRFNTTVVSVSKADYAQAELLRRNTKALIEANKSADHYADRMMGLSLIVGLITLLQLMFMIIDSNANTFQKISYGIGMFALVAFAFWDYFVNKDE